MQLLRFGCQHPPTKRPPSVIAPFDLGQINLFVGKNASGKSRTLWAIYRLALNLSERVTNLGGIGFTTYNVTLGEISPQRVQLEYNLSIRNNVVIAEDLLQNGEVRLNRQQDGNGSIQSRADSQGQPFLIPKDKLAAVYKRDLRENQFLEDLIGWAAGVHLFDFNSDEDQIRQPAYSLPSDSNSLAVAAASPHAPLVMIFQSALQLIDVQFSETIAKQMRDVGFPVQAITVTEFAGPSGTAAKVALMSISEADLPGPLMHTEISQGMYRTLSLLVRIEVLTRLKQLSLIMIDDIGEGLDFERSSRFIKLLMELGKTRQLQIALSTNDRFVMNEVPLEYWQILCRQGTTVSVVNQRNSKRKFDEFSRFGLSNFDFFAQDFFVNQSEKTQSDRS